MRENRKGRGYGHMNSIEEDKLKSNMLKCVYLRAFFLIKCKQICIL